MYVAGDYFGRGGLAFTRSTADGRGSPAHCPAIIRASTHTKGGSDEQHSRRDRLRWQPGRRSFAQAEGRGIGLIDVATRRRRVVAAAAGSAATLATVDRGRDGSVIHTIEGHALRWEKTARRNHWAIREQDRTMLVIAASQGLRRSCVHISVEQTMPEQTAVLLCLIGGYLALSELQYKADLAAATAAAAAGSG